MRFKKSALTVAVFSFFLGAAAYAETNGWGAVATESDPNAWGASVSETAEIESVQRQIEPAKTTQAACGQDDPRYARIAPVLNELKAGQSIEPLQTSFSTYMTLNSKVRTMLGDNIYISSTDCSEQHLFDGDLMGKIVVPFTDLWQVINDSLRTDDQAMLRFIVNNTRAAPESALSVISMVQFVHLDTDQQRKLFAVIAPNKAESKTPEQALMLELFLAFSGTISEADKGKTVFLNNRHDGTMHGIYIEKNGGNVKIEGIHNIDNIVPRISTMLQVTGLQAQAAGKEAEELASK